MTKLFLKIHFIARTAILLLCGIGSFIMIGQEATWMKVVGYGLLGLMCLIMYYDRKASNIEKFEKKEKEAAEKKQKVAVKKYPFADAYDGYVLKWAYYNENVAGSRYLSIPYNELKVGEKLTLVKDSSNPHDKNAIKVLYENHHLGYIHKNHIQEMFNKYSSNENFIIHARLNSIDEVNKKLQLEIAFYQKFDQNCFSVDQVVKAVVVNTSSYQEIWKDVHVNDYLKIEYGDQALVSYKGKIIGELKAADFKKLSSYTRDYRIVYKVGAISGSKDKNNLTGRIDAYVIGN